jgi:hypothetical protein
MELNEEELRRHLEDLSVIKKTVGNMTDRPYVEPWMYVAWGLIVAAAAALGYPASIAWGLDARGIMLAVWAPAIAVGGFLELFSALRILRREGRPLFTASMTRFILAFLHYFVFAGAALYALIDLPGLPLAGIVLLFATMPVVFIAQMSYAAFFLNGFAGLAFGVALLAADPGQAWGFPLAAGFTALNFIAMGIEARLIELRRKGG